MVKLKENASGNLPCISIVVPVFNVEPYLSACIESIFMQTYRNLEVIFVDDGSTDRSADILEDCAEKDPRVHIIHQNHQGPSGARNHGLDQCNGEYITFVDADDLLDNEYVEYLYCLAKRHGTKMSICKHRVVFGHRVKDYGSDGQETVLRAEDCIERMLYDDGIDTSAWAKLYHRSILEDIRFPEGKLFEDISTTYRLMLKSETIAIGNMSKYSYLMQIDSIVNSPFSMKKLDLLEMTDRMADDLVKKIPSLENAVLRRQVYARFSTLNQMIRVKDVKRERNQLISFIHKNAPRILRDEKAPRRDKIAIILLLIGYPVYCIAWMIYSSHKI